jgi:hypothetical protein
MKRTVVMAAFITGVGALHGAASQPDALARLRDALGGETALSAVRTLRVRSTIDRQPHKDNVEVAVSLPDRFVRTLRYLRVPEFPRASATHYDVHDLNALNLAGGDGPGMLVSGFNGQIALPEQSRYDFERRPELKAQRLDGAHARFAEFALPLFGNTSPAYPVQATSEGDSITFRGTAGRSWRLTLDPVTHLPARLTWTSPVPLQSGSAAQPIDWQVYFSDFKPVSGLRWPHRLIKSRNGTVGEDSTIERYEINVKLSDKTFRK